MKATGAGTLHIKCPRREVRRKLSECLVRAGAVPRSLGEQIAVQTDDMDRLALELSGELSGEEQATATALFKPEQGENPRAPRCLRCFLREAQERWVAGMLRPGRMTAVFQPIVRCGHREVFGFEALMRADGGGPVPFDATRVLAAAREAGLLRQLDSHACRTAVSEAARHNVSTKLFINVTPSSLCGSGHNVNAALRLLERLRLSPHQIVLEIVESEPVADWTRLRKVLRGYRECGFQVALDDFGAAYSSPVTLCELRPDYVKLDRTLIRDVHADPCRAALNHKLIEAARAFGARVVAEGVETADEYRWVLESGVDFAQGFYISRPAAPPPFMRAA
jgi:EAL domain-containing protein (putative c-di-GMP-specific phosphodiesterase class I)